MSWRHSSLVVLVLVALLVGACGSLPTDSPTAAETGAPTTSPTAADTPVPATSAPEGPAAEPGDVADPDNYRAMGQPDAPVTIIEYSDFQ